VTLKRGLDWSVDVAVIDRGRILRGWTRRDLARQAHVDEGTLCDLFAGRRRPTFATLRTICRALALPLQAAITFSDGDSAALSAWRLGSSASMSQQPRPQTDLPAGERDHWHKEGQSIK
jgi:transcriptional regulator with XRE-family HTH domain